MDPQEEYQFQEETTSIQQNQGQTSSEDGYIDDQSEQGLEDAAWVSKVQEDQLQSGTRTGGKNKKRHDHRHGGQQKTKAARLKGDSDFAKVFDGTKTLKKGDKGMDVTKLQQALVDIGQALAVSGDFDDDTEKALKAYQKNAGVSETGELDKATITAMDSRFDQRQDYLTAASDFDTADPKKGTRALSAKEKKAAKEALKPKAADPTKSAFQAKDAVAYSAEIKAELATIIKEFHKELYEDMKPLRAKPDENFFKGNDLEGAANAGKDVTDDVYGDLNTGPVFKMGTSLIDQWKDEEDNQKLLDPAGKKEQAVALVEYFIDSNCGDINKKYNAIPGEAEEVKALKSVIEFYVDSDDKIKTLLEIDTGWEGSQADGKQFLQMYKSKDKEENRQKLWEIFHVSIHEYLHTLAHAKYNKWAKALGGSQEHTLVEGFCDFFTLNVQAKFPASTLKGKQKQIEGSYHNDIKPDKIPDVADLDGVSVYSSNEEAERMVGIIGIKNAQLGYFRGEVKLMGK